MVDLLIFIGIIVVVMGGILGGALWMRRARPGQTRIVLLGVAGGEAEAQLWAQKLRGMGIGVQVRQVGDVQGGDLITPGGVGPWGYEYEVWVRPKDEAQARKALGL